MNEEPNDLSDVPTINAKQFEERWRRAGYAKWPPEWRDIIPKLTDQQITELLEKMPKGSKFK